jgi:hypothetical protein
MEKLTEEQRQAIRYIKKLAISYEDKSFDEIFPEAFVEPERKKIVVEISYNEVPNSDNSEDEGLDAECINICLTNKGSRIIPERNVKVKELPEVHTVEDMLKFAHYCLKNKFISGVSTLIEWEREETKNEN